MSKQDELLAPAPSGACALRIEKPWMLVDPTSGNVEIRFFATEAEAVAAAERTIAEARKDAMADGWPEDIEGVRVCRVTHAIRANTRQRPECECEDQEDCGCEASEFGEWDELMYVELVACKHEDGGR